MIISKLVIQYEAQGAERAEKADGKVRKSLKKTGKTAKKEETVIERWMKAHKTALTVIAAASAGLLLFLLKSSPTISAELSSIRLAFSLLAMMIMDTVAPIFIALEGYTWKLVEAYEGLSPPVKAAVNAMVIFIATLAAITIVAIAVVGILAALGVSLVLAATLLALAAAGMIVVGVLTFMYEKFGLVGLALGLLILPFIAFVGILYLLIKHVPIVGKLTEMLKKAFIGLGLAAYGALQVLKKGFIWLGLHVYDLFVTPISDAVASAYQWGKDFVSEFAKGLADMGKVSEKAFGNVKKVFSFDIHANDMMVFKWGMDFAKFMAKGIHTGFGGIGAQSMAGVAAPPSPTGGGGVNITIEQGAINMNGGTTPEIDTRALADVLYNRIRDDMGARF